MGEQRDTFDGIADLYAAVRPQVPAPAVEALWAHLAVPPGGSVLEVGCGTGQLTKHLAARECWERHRVAVALGAEFVAYCTGAMSRHARTAKRCQTDFFLSDAGSRGSERAKSSANMVSISAAKSRS